MAKHLMLLHVGPVEPDVAAMTRTLTAGQVAVPDVPADTHRLAGVELRRSHKAAGLKRKQVEGSWARVCRRARKTGADCFVSVPGMLDATPEQVALTLDGVSDFRVVLLLTTGFDAAPPAAWTAAVRPDRTHLLPAGLGPEQLAAQVARIARMEAEERLLRRSRKAPWKLGRDRSYDLVS